MQNAYPIWFGLLTELFVTWKWVMCQNAHSGQWGGTVSLTHWISWIGHWGNISFEPTMCQVRIRELNKAWKLGRWCLVQEQIPLQVCTTLRCTGCVHRKKPGWWWHDAVTASFFRDLCDPRDSYRNFSLMASLFLRKSTLSSRVKLYSYVGV